MAWFDSYSTRDIFTKTKGIFKKDRLYMEANPVQSPCNNKCIMDEKTKLCIGCYRTIDEIVSWISLSDNEKLSVWEKVNERKLNRKE